MKGKRDWLGIISGLIGGTVGFYLSGVCYALRASIVGMNLFDAVFVSVLGILLFLLSLLLWFVALFEPQGLLDPDPDTVERRKRK